MQAVQLPVSSDTQPLPCNMTHVSSRSTCSTSARNVLYCLDMSAMFVPSNQVTTLTCAQSPAYLPKTGTFMNTDQCSSLLLHATAKQDHRLFKKDLDALTTLNQLATTYVISFVGNGTIDLCWQCRHCLFWQGAALGQISPSSALCGTHGSTSGQALSQA